MFFRTLFYVLDPIGLLTAPWPVQFTWINDFLLIIFDKVRFKTVVCHCYETISKCVDGKYIVNSLLLYTQLHHYRSCDYPLSVDIFFWMGHENPSQ